MPGVDQFPNTVHVDLLQWHKSNNADNPAFEVPNVMLTITQLDPVPSHYKFRFEPVGLDSRARKLHAFDLERHHLHWLFQAAQGPHFTLTVSSKVNIKGKGKWTFVFSAEEPRDQLYQFFNAFKNGGEIELVPASPTYSTGTAVPATRSSIPRVIKTSISPKASRVDATCKRAMASDPYAALDSPKRRKYEPHGVGTALLPVKPTTEPLAERPINTAALSALGGGTAGQSLTRKPKAVSVAPTWPDQRLFDATTSTATAATRPPPARLPVAKAAVASVPVRPKAVQSLATSQPPLTRRRSSLRLEGMKNNGNTCYQNAILTALLSLPPFTERVRALVRTAEDSAAHHSGDVPEAKTTLGAILARMVAIRIEQPSAMLDPHDFNRYIESQTIPGFLTVDLTTNLKDAQELFIECLTILETEMPPNTDPIWSPAHLFDSQVEKIVECTACHLRSRSVETHRGWSVDVRAGREMQTLLADFLSHETLEYACKCGHREAVVTQALIGLPAILVVHLKRFQYHPTMHTLTKRADSVGMDAVLDLAAMEPTDVPPIPPEDEAKVNKTVAIPDPVIQVPDSPDSPFLALDPDSDPMQQDVESSEGGLMLEDSTSSMSTGTDATPEPASSPPPGPPPPPPALDLTRPEPTVKETAQYQLAAVVSHLGRSMERGHYTADVKSAARGGVWVTYDDSVVSDLGSDADLQAKRKQVGYLLFYLRVPPGEEGREGRVH
ncbi:Ubiquitin carboxyl-terminal hydrolase 46 [Allomyces arbusculus]|nr:Ubiquitin carboxyl-terminal hydrolase 46 [Allomyces arbusculus]